MADYSCKQGDVLPLLTDTLTYSDGTAVNLSGASVQFVMRAPTAASVTTQAAATITNAGAGGVSYTFTATDTATAGAYLGNWAVTFATGQLMTFPTVGYLDIVIEENLTTVGGARVVSLAEIKDHLRMPDTDRTRDARLVRLLDAATIAIESITGPVLVKKYDEWYDGGTIALQLRHQPVFTLMAVSEYRGPVEFNLALVGDPAHGSVYSAMLDPEGRLVRRAPGGAVVNFLNGLDVVHVIYTAGLTPVPANIREAALELIRIRYDDEEQPGPGSDEIRSGTPLGFFVPNAVREMLVPSRRHPSVA